jgi:hypothetical protein
MKMKIFRQIIINFLRVAYAYTKLIQGPNMGPLLQSLEIFPQGQSINAEDGYPPNNGIICCCIDRIVVSGLCCNVAGAATATLVSSKVIHAVITPSRTIWARRRSRSICGLEHWWLGGNTRA